MTWTSVTAAARAPVTGAGGAMGCGRRERAGPVAWQMDADGEDGKKRGRIKIKTVDR